MLCNSIATFCLSNYFTVTHKQLVTCVYSLYDTNVFTIYYDDICATIE